MTRLVAAAVVVALGAASGGLADAAPAPLVVRMRCATDGLQTGFLLEGIDGVVTALHGVAGCTNVTVEVGDAVHAVKIASYNLAADLAVLARSDGVAFDGMRYPRGGPSVNGTVVGYPHAVGAPLRTQLRLRSVAPVALVSLVPRGEVVAVATRGSPAPGLSVFSVEGHLTEGHSGAPLLNTAGQVFAMADGGLKKGTTEIGWAVPISELDQRTPGDLPTGIHQTLRMTSELLFSERSSSIDAMPATVICAGRKFSLVRGVWLDELVAEVDDSETYRQLAYAYGLLGTPHEFAVYRDLAVAGSEARTSATVLVPAGWSVAAGPSCEAKSPTGITLVLELRASAPNAISSTYGVLEFGEFCTRGYYIDPRFSNWTSRTTVLSGIVTQRKSYLQYDVRCALPNMPPQAWTMPGVPWLSPISPAPAGIYQCGPPMCPMTPGGQTIPYPQAWGAMAMVPNPVKGVGFLSAVGSQKLLLFAYLRHRDPAQWQALEACTTSLDLSAACQQVRALAVEWGLGVLAATAATLMP